MKPGVFLFPDFVYDCMEDKCTNSLEFLHIRFPYDPTNCVKEIVRAG